MPEQPRHDGLGGIDLAIEGVCVMAQAFLALAYLVGIIAVGAAGTLLFLLLRWVYFHVHLGIS